jgi:hypothetical protein
MSSLIPNSTVPEGQSGPWKVERFYITTNQALAFNFQQATDIVRHAMRLPSREIREGTYTRIMCNGKTIMSDTPAEKADHEDFVRRAHGHVLITGLGLGMVAEACLRRKAVKSVTVIEKSPHVIKLTQPHLMRLWDDCLTVVQGDALKIAKNLTLTSAYRTLGRHLFDCAWHDIWPTISDGNLSQMKALNLGFKKIVTDQSFWCYHECEAMKNLLEKARAYNHANRKQYV